MKNNTEKITISAVIVISIVLLLLPIVCFPLKNQSEFENHVRKDVFEKLPELKWFDISQNITSYSVSGECYELIEYKKTNKVFSKMLDYAKSNSIVTYHSSDSCIVSKYRGNASCGKIPNYYPVFEECLNWFDEELADGFSKKELKYNDVQYYVLDCKEGWFLKDDKLKNVEGKATKYLRARAFEHGYSVGAIVDKERLRIAYWVMVW
ncbi:MAG: hypothetical protein PUG15_03500 [Bacteroidales bacterium]|nr:hypothetical protein [Bacteroidales bacterium]